MSAGNSLAAEWARYDGVKARLASYLVSSEEEFASLIEALDTCWTLSETLQEAANRLNEATGTNSGSLIATVRETMLDGCQVFREFLDQIHGVSNGLLSTLHETWRLLNNSNRLQEDLTPLNYIAFAFRLEGARLSPEDNEALVRVYEEMHALLTSMKQSGESQRQTLHAIVSRLSAASASIKKEAASFALRATSAEKRIHADLDLLAKAPSPQMGSQNSTAAAGAQISDSIREAAKALQGHDAIRQQMEHVFASLEDVRKGRGMEAGHALVLQRQHVKHIRELIESAGDRIERELKTVTAAAQSLAGDGDKRVADTAEAEAFESAVDRLTTMSGEIAGLLDGEMILGRSVMAEIEPLYGLLNSKSQELESLASSLKMLALNVLITAEQIPGAREVDVLGSWTADAAERVLALARSLNAEFSGLGSSLQTRSDAVMDLLNRVEGSRTSLVAMGNDGNLRNSRRDAVAVLGQEGMALQRKTATLLQSLTFVQQGRGLLDELVVLVENLLLLYPAPKAPLDLAAASARYAMQDQHEVHASVFGLEGGIPVEKFARLTEPAQGDDYGDNVELF